MERDGYVDITVYTNTGEACAIPKLDNYCDAFNKCKIDTFIEEEAKECLGFEVPEHDIVTVNVENIGSDSWQPEFFK